MRARIGMLCGQRGEVDRRRAETALHARRRANVGSDGDATGHHVVAACRRCERRITSGDHTRRAQSAAIIAGRGPDARASAV